MKLMIRHDPGRGRFFASIGGAEAYLVYTVTGARTLDFTHTYVPDALRHRNIGEAIVKHALDYAAVNGFEVRGLYANPFFSVYPLRPWSPRSEIRSESASNRR